MAIYSSSKHDVKKDTGSHQADEVGVKKMYEYSPYPDLGANLKDLSLYLNPIREDLRKKKNLKFLDVGCGTGHVVVNIAKQNPHWDCMGLDLSDASLNIARQLATKHKVNVELLQGSYLKPLPFEGQFDVICAMGTIHHCADPLSAMHVLRNTLKDDGFLLLHMYGLRCDSKKFDMKEVLSILEPNLSNYQNRFNYYDALMKHKKQKLLKRLFSKSPLDIYFWLKIKWRNIKRRLNNTSWSPAWNESFNEPNAPWIDHFSHPCERAYEVPEIKELIEGSGFEVVKMLKQGKEFKKLIPLEWDQRYKQLNKWDKYRLSELLAEGGGSFAIILRKNTQASQNTVH
jgi:SAM-dependent methyltransferase